MGSSRVEQNLNENCKNTVETEEWEAGVGLLAFLLEVTTEEIFFKGVEQNLNENCKNTVETEELWFGTKN